MKRLWRLQARCLPTVIAAGFQMAGGAMNAQEPDAQTIARKERCEAMARRVEDRSVALPAAVNQLVSCGEETARLVPARWRTVTADSAQLNALIRLSISFHDKRILREVRVHALSETQPYAVRGAALAVLASYHNPTLTGNVRRDKKTGVLTPSMGHYSHVSYSPGPQPLGPAEYAEVDSVLKQLASEKGPTDIPIMAKFVLATTKEACKYPRSRALIHSCPQ